MNWRRGLFRLWIAGSFLWIAILSALAYVNWPAEVMHTIPDFPSKEEIDACQAKQPDPKHFELECLKPTSGHIETSADYSTIKNYGIAAIAVPLAFLAFGFGTKWVVAGFGPRHNP
jgi:hypothetical protein